MRYLDGRANRYFTRVRLFLSRDHAEQRGFARAVGTDDADDGAGRHFEAQVIDQQAIAVGFAKHS